MLYFQCLSVGRHKPNKKLVARARKIVMNTFLAVLFLFAMMISPASAQKKKSNADSIAIREVRELEQQRVHASLTADTSALSRLHADDYVVITALGRSAGKSEELRIYSSGEIQTRTLELSELRFRVYGKTVLVTGVGHRKDVLRGEARDFRYRYTRVWAKINGRWQIVNMQATPMTDR